MTLESFPNQFLQVLMDVISDNRDSYKLISAVPFDDKHTNVELEGINSPFDLLALGIRIGIDYADRNSIERIVPEVAKLVKKDLQQSEN